MEIHNLIQVAGVIDRDEADLLIDSGVNYLGFPLRLPVNSEALTEAEAASIIRSLHPPAFGVLVTYQRKKESNQGSPVCCRGQSRISLHRRWWKIEQHQSASIRDVIADLTSSTKPCHLCE